MLGAIPLVINDETMKAFIKQKQKKESEVGLDPHDSSFIANFFSN